MAIIAVFGSASVFTGDKAYDESVEVGKVLAEHGYTVMSGGYAGVMEAVSKGASHAGGHAIGVTTRQVGEKYNLKANAWVTEEICYDEIRDRLFHMVENADAYLAMPGGVGTLHELAETWELMRLDGIPHRPLMVYGEMWETIISTLRNTPFVDEAYCDMLHYVFTPQDVLDCVIRNIPNDSASE